MAKEMIARGLTCSGLACAETRSPWRALETRIHCTLPGLHMRAAIDLLHDAGGVPRGCGVESMRFPKRVDLTPTAMVNK